MRLLVVLGPTGTGKSKLALALARRLDGELVGCDAVQLYCGFDTATAKPSADDRRMVPHHLVDEIDPRLDFTLADFVRSADRAIDGIAARGRLPIVVGGTGLYLRGLLRGVFEAPARNEPLRRRLYAIAARRGGNARLHRLLERLDAPSARRLPPADTQRLVRALELALGGEATWSERLSRDGTWTSGRERYRALKLGLEADRDALAGRLDRRVERFFAAGLADEVRALLRQGVPPTANAFKAIGYREVLAALREGSPPGGTLGEVQRKTRRYAKRQRTWFRREPDVVWLDALGDFDDLVDRATELWRSFTDGDARRGA